MAPQAAAAAVLFGLASAAGSTTPEAQEARRYLEAGIRAYRLGRESFDAEPLGRAKRLLAHAVELQPSAAGYFYLGGTLGLLSRPRAAIRAYLASLHLDPSVPAAHQNVAQLLDDLGNRSAAFVHYRHWAKLEPGSASARKAFAMSHLWSGDVETGARLCSEAVDLDPKDPSIPFDCAQSLILLLPPEQALPESTGLEENVGDGSSPHYLHRILPLFQGAQRASLAGWRGGPEPDLAGTGIWGATTRWQPTLGLTCPNGARAVREWGDGGDKVEQLSPGGEVYGQRVPKVFGGPFTWAGQRYVERGVRVTALRNVVLSGNEGVITRGCDVFIPYYDVQVPWHENLPHRAAPEDLVPRLPAALWLLVMFPANFFSFLVDELARLAVWLTTRHERLPLLVPADRGQLKGFMYDWFTLLGGFQIVPYDVRPHFMGPERVAAPRFVVEELHIVDWHDPPGIERRWDVFLLPPRFALRRLRDLALGQALGATGRASGSAGGRILLWIQRAVATTRRVANEDELLLAMQSVLEAQPGPPWTIKLFSDVPPAPSASETVHMFSGAEIVVGLHGSGQANQIFCTPGTGVIDINLPEPHSQYTAHNSYALGLRYRLVMMEGIALHQTVNVTVPVVDVVAALRSLLAEPAA